MSDTEMRQRLVQGDEDAFAEIFGALNPSLIRLATALTGSRAVAEEVTQETWLAVISGIERFAGKSSLKNWVFAILANKARTRARQEGRTTVRLDHTSKAGSGDADTTDPDSFDDSGRWREPPMLWDEITPERTLAGRQAWEIVTDAIKALPTMQQAILDLVQRENLAAAEVATLLGISPGNVRIQLHRARERIRRQLDQAQTEPHGGQKSHGCKK